MSQSELIFFLVLALASLAGAYFIWNKERELESQIVVTEEEVIDAKIESEVHALSDDELELIAEKRRNGNKPPA